MRLRITLEPERGRMSLPVHYNHILQGVVYHHLDRVLSDWLHNAGHAYNQRRFKLFTFSRLFGKSRVENGRIFFTGPVHFYLGAVDDSVMRSFAEHLLREPEVRLGQSKCHVREVGVQPAPEIDSAKPIRFKALSPITAYSTFTKPEGGKRTCYYTPQERQWSEQLISNLARKAKALDWAADMDGDPEGSWIRPHEVRSSDQTVIRYKSTIIKAWTGIYEAKLPEPYFRLAYDAGLGAKNGQGFGMVAVSRR